MRFTLAVIFALAVFVPPCPAQDIVRDSIPWRWIEPLVPEDLPTIKHPAYYTDLEKARAEAFAGRYKLSLQTLRHVKGADPAQVALIQSEALAALGRLDEAMAALANRAVADQPGVPVARARVLGEMGRWDDAIALLKGYLAKNPTSIEGHYYLGELSEQAGDIESARSAYAWFNADPRRFLDKWTGQADRAFEDAGQVVLIGRALDRWAVLTGAYQNNRPLHDIILSMFVRAYDVIDRTYWPAHLAAAEYFLSHDDEKEAQTELQAAHAGNPNDSRMLALAGQMAVAGYDFDRAEAVIAAMRQVNPDSVPADLLDARNLLQQRRAADAEAPVQRVLARQPKNIEAMGLLAATYALQVHDDKTAAVLKQVDALAPHDATAYMEVAGQLGAMRQYPRSAAMYQIAIDRAPWWTAARNGLGLLYTQSGDEDQARTVLDAAHALDPFNIHTTNYLRLLDTLGAFARKESAHFIVLYDEKLDPMIPLYFSDYLESVYSQVCAEFHHEPALKTMIEVFPTHDEFSVRTTGSPWIGTVGASTGRVIALVAPRKGKNTMGSYNWSQVLRHEFTHTVTLSATDNRIAHWMTEGLAVYQEHSPLRWEWVPMLYNAVQHGTLFTMDELTWGFIRPRRPIDRQLAYAQSFWVCQYIHDTWGQDVILKMMDAFKRGEREEEVFQSVLGKSREAFRTEFVAWTKKQVAGWGYDKETSRKYDDLKAAAEGFIKSHQYVQAARAWEQIARLRPVDALPHQRLAGIYLTQEARDTDKAIENLLALDRVEIKDDRYAKKIARLYQQDKRLDLAMQYAMQSVYIDPYDLDAHQLLSALCDATGNTAGAEREKRVIPVLQAWIERNRREVEEPVAP